MSFGDIIAAVQHLTADEKRQLFELLERDLCSPANEESPEFVAMLETRISAADNGGRSYSLAQARDALKKLLNELGQ